MCYLKQESPQSPQLRGFWGHTHSLNRWLTTPVVYMCFVITVLRKRMLPLSHFCAHIVYPTDHKRRKMIASSFSCITHREHTKVCKRTGEIYHFLNPCRVGFIIPEPDGIGIKSRRRRMYTHNPVQNNPAWSDDPEAHSCHRVSQDIPGSADDSHYVIVKKCLLCYSDFRKASLKRHLLYQGLLPFQARNKENHYED